MKLIKKLIELAHHIKFNSQFTGIDEWCSGHEEMGEVEYRSRFFIGIYDFFRMMPLVILCHFKGHKWTVDSCISPDSGSEYFYCDRCGESHDICYY